MNVTAIQTSLFRKGDNLLKFIEKHVPVLKSEDVLVITSKIVALSEGRTVKLQDKERVIKGEAEQVIKTPWALLTLLGGGWSINAGVDESNADSELIMLPKDAFKTAKIVREALMKKYKLNKLGVVITDTKSVPLRKGTLGRALGYAGFVPLKSYIGKKDLFGRKSRLTESNHPDAIAAAAVMVMGEGDERTPLAIVRGAPVKFISTSLSPQKRTLDFPIEKDIFSYLFKPVRMSPAPSTKRKNPKS